MRVVTIGLTAVLSLIGALAATANFLHNFNNFLLLILYLFVPWTAVNLFVGLPVAAVLYYVFTLSVDVAAETRVAQSEAAELEEAAAQHELP